MFKKLSLTFVLFVACCISFAAFLLISPSHAYFQGFTALDGVNSAKIDLLFDKFDANGTYGDYEITLNDDNWGTEENPYLLTKKNHVSNLFVLQRSGYFLRKTNSDGSARQSHFMVCDPADGTPIVIDCEGMTINPIGSHDNPFTGCLQGAPVAGTAAYGNYTVSQSAIANLEVLEVENTPDIGFFGRLGYNGTIEKVVSEEKDDDGNVIASVETYELTGFSANLNNLLFADITISTTQSPGSSLSTWWANFTGKDTYHEDCNETHHLGIIAGHAEWAHITNISVYYSEDVPAFDVGAGTTNYYSIVGLLGTLSYVNPSEGDAANILSAIGSVSDEQLKDELLSGGGGEGSGMLTGYMLAENIFERKDAGNTMTLLDGYAEAYDVKNMTEDGEKIFTEVVMPERDIPIFQDWENHYYYYFADTVFTFAMSTERDEENENAIDYVVKLWNIDESQNWAETDDISKVPPPIYLTDSADANNDGAEDNWHYGTDENIKRYTYQLTAVTQASQLVAGSKYVLAYRDTDGILHSLDIGNSNGYVRSFKPYEDIITDEDGNVQQTFATEYFTAGDSSSGIKSMYVLSSTAANCQYAFLYKPSAYSSNNVTISSLDGSQWLGLESTPGFLSMNTPKLYVGNKKQDSGHSVVISTASGYRYNWTIALTNANTVTLAYDNASFGASGDFVFDAKFIFSSSNKQFQVQIWNNDYDTPSLPENASAELLLFKVSDTATQIFQSQNVMPNTGKVVHKFNPSTDVLFYDKATNGYIATPLLQKQWNNGLGEYLTSLNHAVKMFQAAPQNFQLTLSNTFIGDWFGNALDTNAGDVVLAPLGTTGINFTTPTGMIAYYVNKASTADPSMINIVVAVNPEQQASTIGLWGPQALDSYRSDFDIDDPYDSFPVPASKSALSDEDRKTYMTKVSGYYTYDSTSNKYVLHNDGYATYLGGKIVLVGYTFTVTEPGVYLMGSTTGPMSVCYFSVDGAAGSGGDGTGGSPLGDVDFVYDNGSDKIITVDQKFSGSHIVSGETPETLYYPSYSYIRMIPDADYNIEDGNKNDTQDGKIPSEELYIRRYLVDDPPTVQGITSDRRRVIKLTAADDDTHLLGLSAIYQDVNYDTIDTSS